MLICDENKCTGCGACVNLCPTDSIKMKENMERYIQKLMNRNVWNVKNVYDYVRQI